MRRLSCTVKGLDQAMSLNTLFSWLSNNWIDNSELTAIAYLEKQTFQTLALGQSKMIWISNESKWTDARIFIPSFHHFSSCLVPFLFDYSSTIKTILECRLPEAVVVETLPKYSYILPVGDIPKTLFIKFSIFLVLNVHVHVCLIINLTSESSNSLTGSHR